VHPPAIRLERAIATSVGWSPKACPITRPWLRHGGAISVPFRRRREPAPDPGGPVHAGIIEPGHFRFTANGETVVRLEAAAGYVHKGIEALMAGARLDARRAGGRVSGDSTVAYASRSPGGRGGARRRSAAARRWLRALAAELERLANHFGDIGAVCNDAAFAHDARACGLLREQVCAPRRLLRPSPDDGLRCPGGMRRRPRRRRRQRCALVATARRRFPELVELYENTASLQGPHGRHGILSRELAGSSPPAAMSGAPRAQLRRAAHAGYAPYDRAAVRGPVVQAGDVNARVWIRIREVEQSLALSRADPAPAAGRAADAVTSAVGSRAKGGAGRGLPRRHLAWVGSAPTARSIAATCATRRGSSGRCSRRRSKATSSPTSRCATSRSTARIPATISRGTHAQTALRAFVHGRSPSRRRRDERRWPSSARRWRSCAQAARPRSSIREVDAGSCNGCELEIHALNNAFYDLERFGLRFVASPRHADVLLVTGR
jgi:Ni,Fe-hydrogenase III large subunit